MAADDIHMAIEARLIVKIGETGKISIRRSRNDQVALDERLYLRRTMKEMHALLRGLQRVLVSKAHAYRDVIMPGYTHLQRAQPILLAHHLLAYVEMLERDRGRYADCLRRAARSPLGAAALAGTPFPVDREASARLLGLDGIVENSIDAVSDRDALIECVSACALTMMHLSRLAEDLVLWVSQEWRFATIGEAFTTGSSIMPQKQNPDMAELVRGKTGRVYGDLVALLTVMKGLPLAYNRDMQEDKEPLFDAWTPQRHRCRSWPGCSRPYGLSPRGSKRNSAPTFCWRPSSPTICAQGCRIPHGVHACRCRGARVCRPPLFAHGPSPEAVPRHQQEV